MSASVRAVKVLIVEDEANIRSGLRDVLQSQGHQVAEAEDGQAALQALATEDYEVAIVDIRMPGMSGIQVLEAMRTQRPHLAVIMLTGNGTLETAMAAVRGGAHDYLLKPAQPATIRATVVGAAAAARRRRAEAQLVESMRDGIQRLDDLPAGEARPPTSPAGRLAVGNLHINTHSHEVWCAGRRVHLSPTEFKVLVALASQPGKAVTYEQLAADGLGYRVPFREARGLIKRHIFSLRRKIETDPAQPGYLRNVRGVGYRLVAPDS